MNKEKDTPNLPGSSRMQMPSTGGNSMNGSMKEKGGMAKKRSGKKGMKGCNPY